MWPKHTAIIVYITRNLRMQRRRIKPEPSTTTDSIEVEQQENLLNTAAPALPLSEDDMVKIKERHSMQQLHHPIRDIEHKRSAINYQDEALDSAVVERRSKKKKILTDYKVQHPLTEPITHENQDERLLRAVTPLCKLPYYQQLNIKQDHARLISQFLKKELREAKVPLQPSMDRLLCPMDRVSSSPEIVSYRNKDEFSINIGVDRNPKTVGYYVGLPNDPLMTCIPPSGLPNIRSGHKLIAQHFQNFIRASRHETCIKFSAGGVWKNLIVRSTLKDQKMASVQIFPKFLQDGEKDEIKDQLNEYFFKGPGTECELSSLYLQACPHTRCSRETAPYELIAGETHITEQCSGMTFKISPDSFFQTNTKAAEILYETIEKLAEVSSLTTILDICCGTGTMSNLLAPKVRGTLGVDVVSAAIEDAKLNSQINGNFNTNFIPGKVEKILSILTEDLLECSEVIAIVSPARGGLHPSVVNTLRNTRSIRKLLYVTSNPGGNAAQNMAHLGTTLPLKREGKLAIDGDPFVPTYMALIDIFPQTLHLEYVILFERISVD